MGDESEGDLDEEAGEVAADRDAPLDLQCEGRQLRRGNGGLLDGGLHGRRDGGRASARARSRASAAGRVGGGRRAVRVEHRWALALRRHGEGNAQDQAAQQQHPRPPAARQKAANTANQCKRKSTSHSMQSFRFLFITQWRTRVRYTPPMLA